MTPQTINIATILTCHNRKQKTIASLRSVFNAQEFYNSLGKEKLELELFITDDGCTDGTSEAIQSEFHDKKIKIVKGSGNLFWAGGMRLAWKEAFQNNGSNWAFYLLLNDDTIVMNNVFEELLNTHSYSLTSFGLPGIYSGITCDFKDTNIITYSGDRFNSAAKGKWTRLGPTGTPQIADQTNANILLVSSQVVDSIGTFHDGYIHSCADYDYCMEAKRHGFTTLITGNVCGYCEYDHISDGEETRKLINMPLLERIKYVHAPTHSDDDYLLFVKRNIPQKYVISWILRKTRMLFPSIYYKICKARGLESYK